MSVRIITGDCREKLVQLPAQSVHCIVTSPPYWGLRDYGVPGQIGLEPNFRDYIETMGELFRQVWRVLRDDGTLWLNLGDSYAGGGRGGNPDESPYRKQATNTGSVTGVTKNKWPMCGLKPKDMAGIPWRVALTLQTNGWYLRQDIIWSKPNPMPESVTDRCTKAHEYLFLLSKNERYYYDADAIAEKAVYVGLANQDESGFKDPRAFNGKHKKGYNSSGPLSEHMKGTPRNDGDRWRLADGGVAPREERNKRSVWEIATSPFPEAHFATFPPALIEPCILAGCPKGGTVLDPFGGAGTTGLVADRLGRNAILIELNPDYADMARRRITNDAPMFAQVT